MLFRSWLSNAFHPFIPLQLAPHTPRLRLGRVIVQRRTWHVRADEMEHHFPKALPAELVLAVEKLRARRGLPRWTYVRPVMDSSQRLSLEGTAKDVKPVCIDLESYPFIDIFARELERHGRLEVAEMLPTPEQLLWREADGRYSFELRTAYQTRD